MKKLLILIFLVSLSLAGMSQGQRGFKGFFKPVSATIFATDTKEFTNASAWAFRPTVEISALQLMWNKEKKNFDASSLKSAGPGLSYSHYINLNGEAYNNFSINGLILFGLAPGETVQSTVSGALTVSAFEYLNLGGGYDFAMKKPFILTGVTLKF